MLEADLQAQVIQIARAYGWLIHHCRPAQSSKGRWMTPITGDAGFPDLVLARGNRVLFVELKSDKGKLSPAQKTWLGTLVQAAEAYTWYPSDLKSAAGVLR